MIKKIFKYIKSYQISKDMWKAKMKEPVIYRKMTDEEILAAGCQPAGNTINVNNTEN